MNAPVDSIQLTEPPGKAKGAGNGPGASSQDGFDVVLATAQAHADPAANPRDPSVLPTDTAPETDPPDSEVPDQPGFDPHTRGADMKAMAPGAVRLGFTPGEHGGPSASVGNGGQPSAKLAAPGPVALGFTPGEKGGPHNNPDFGDGGAQPFLGGLGAKRAPPYEPTPDPVAGGIEPDPADPTTPTDPADPADPVDPTTQTDPTATQLAAAGAPVDTRPSSQPNGVANGRPDFVPGTKGGPTDLTTHGAQPDAKLAAPGAMGSLHSDGRAVGKGGHPDPATRSRRPTDAVEPPPDEPTPDPVAGGVEPDPADPTTPSTPTDSTDPTATQLAAAAAPVDMRPSSQPNGVAAGRPDFAGSRGGPLDPATRPILAPVQGFIGAILSGSRPGPDDANLSADPQSSWLSGEPDDLSRQLADVSLSRSMSTTSLLALRDLEQRLDSVQSRLAAEQPPATEAAAGPSADAAAARTTAVHGAAEGARPAPEPLRLSVNTPVAEHSRWGGELGDRLAWIASNRFQAATLQINPQQLGPVEVRIRIDGDQASVSFAAVQPQTRDAIQQALPALERAFAEQGLTLGQASIGADGHPRPFDDPARPTVATLDDRPLAGPAGGLATPDILGGLRPRSGLVDTFV